MTLAAAYARCVAALKQGESYVTPLPTAADVACALRRAGQETSVDAARRACAAAGLVLADARAPGEDRPRRRR